jgi:hypothetical protein
MYDKEVIDCKCDSFIECMICLVGAYYVFFLAYPTAYTGALGFLQVQVFEDSANEFHKTNKYIEFSKKFAQV